MKAEKKAKESGNDWKAYQAFGAYIFCLSVYGFQIIDEEPNDGFIIVFPAISNITQKNGNKEGNSYKAI